MLAQDVIRVGATLFVFEELPPLRRRPEDILCLLDVFLDAAELMKVMRHSSGNVAQVSSFFGRDRKQIYHWIERHELDVDSLRDQYPGL